MFGAEDVLDCWFGPLDDQGLADAAHRNRWFRASRSFDQEIRRRFLSMVLVASENGLQDWRDPEMRGRGRLAEIILLDQFSRNIYRGTDLAYASDPFCRTLCREGLDQGADLTLPALYRAFFYMPLQHSERLPDQDRGVALYEQLVASTEGALRDLLGSFLGSARAHRDTIVRFGRFPHRNKVLRRDSTPDETVYLAGGARRYGQ
ncbi:DUF924 family protein [Marinobacter sp. SS21]|uniref:DUF924 family protein n=1 Tax=Marinobacter sp. SS21 TaxID=2979460 RepID=UPI00232EAAF5|nr:DUF924 family protein [Marinobacter sp. SS21]MDC0663314.1 DUF924 domain-containing protein [Marinobacter sp. SS21]